MKIFHKLKDKLHYLTHFPYKDTYRKQLELNVISMNFRSERVITLVMMCLQITMLLIFAVRPGDFSFTSRRFGYVVTYATFLIWFIVFWPIHKRSKENWWLHNSISITFSILMSLWVVSISYLDALGNVSIIVYCSVLPIMAAFLVVPPHILSIVFLFTCIATDCLVLTTPYGKDNMFSVLINSIFICLLSIIYAYRTYHTRLTGVYDKMIIDQKNKQMEAANKELDTLSMTDALTSLGNRRYLEEAVKLPLEKYGIYMGSLSVFLLDIDLFKEYNDRYGHQQGDLCLQTVASVLSSFANAHDFHAIRYGGEEFVLVMTGLSFESVKEKAEQICKIIRETRIPDSSGNETTVTVSVGLSFHAGWEPDFLENAIFEADRALYQAKQDGRNRVVCFRSSQPSAENDH